MRPRALRAAGRLLGFAQRSGLQSLARRSGLTRLLPGDLRRLEPQAPAIARRFSDELIARQETPPGASRVSRGAADGLRAGSRVPRHQSRHRRRAARERLHGRHAVAAAMLRLAARPQRRAGDGGDSRAPDDRSDPARASTTPSSRTRAAADRTCATIRRCSPTIRDTATRAATWDRKLRDVQEWLVEIGCRPP